MILWFTLPTGDMDSVQRFLWYSERNPLTCTQKLGDEHKAQIIKEILSVFCKIDIWKRFDLKPQICYGGFSVTVFESNVLKSSFRTSTYFGNVLIDQVLWSKIIWEMLTSFRLVTLISPNPVCPTLDCWTFSLHSIDCRQWSWHR